MWNKAVKKTERTSSVRWRWGVSDWQLHLPSFAYQCVSQVSDALQQKAQAERTSLGEVVIVRSHVMSGIKAVQGNDVLCVSLSPVEELQNISNRKHRGYKMFYTIKPPPIPVGTPWWAHSFYWTINLMHRNIHQNLSCSVLWSSENTLPPHDVLNDIDQRETFYNKKWITTTVSYTYSSNNKFQ